VTKLTKHRLYWIGRNMLKQAVCSKPAKRMMYDDSNTFPPSDPVVLRWPDGLRKPIVGLVPDQHPKNPYWTKYRRFLETNKIPFQLYDIHKSGWLAAAKDFDMILWRPFSSPPDLEECRRKIFILEKNMGKVCYPTFRIAMIYEDKALQYELMKLHGLPVVETFISHSYSEILSVIPRMQYPVVAKLLTGSGSLGTEFVANEHAARKLAKHVFSFAGRQGYWPFLRQKDYVYFQRFIPGAHYDLRVIIVGDVACGYFRDVPQGEFRASGMHTQRNGELPMKALLIAREVAMRLDLVSVAVDMLYDQEREAFLIIELSTFVLIESTVDAAARLDGVPGVYRFCADHGDYSFEPAEFWLQEWVLREIFRRSWFAQKHTSASCNSTNILDV